MPKILKIKQASQAAPKVHDAFYDSHAWRKLRSAVLKLFPFCQYCQQKDKHVWAKIVDHYLPRTLWPELSLHPPNMRACCAKCHNKKRNIERQFKIKEVLINKLTEYGFN
jgi:5-methylcytosine-specific restriction endonuclease McrA